ncbi:MAG: DUF721 domain-containing protein [Bacteriovoracaceae bacterium]|nr:DUF721 domain-containing protein [Bacteriovoracaceae bacterium]
MFKSLSSMFHDFKGDRVVVKHEAHVDTFFDFLSLVKIWPKIVGDRSAKYTVPLKIQNGVLYVLTNHSAFSFSLNSMQEAVKNNIFKEFPNLKKQIKKIYFQVNSAYFEQSQQRIIKEKSIEESKKASALHPYSPTYRKLKKEALELLENSEVEDLETRELLISIYIQSKL